MKIYNNPPKKGWQRLTERPVIDLEELLPTVQVVFKEIRESGDKAIVEYTEQFDKVNLKTFTVTEVEIEQAEEKLPQELKAAISVAYANIYKFHKSQKTQKQEVMTNEGVVCWREDRPIEKVGLYIPGGTAPLFSTVLMLGIPAQIAGCREVVLCTPPDKGGNIHPAVLYAAKLVGATAVYKVGGIQAIAAMTFGTESIPKTNKVFGPGNQYVMAAKQWAQNYGIAIDMPAGPSEVLVIADKQAIPAFVAADLLSQAEHGVDSQVVLLSDSKKMIDKVKDEVAIQLEKLPRKAIAEQALEHSRVIYFNSLNDCMEFSNMYAPEHLILAVGNPEKLGNQIVNAGSVFLGNLSCESAGDYASGTNHTLPTNGYAASYSGVSLDSFVKKITFQQLNGNGLRAIGEFIETMAAAEELEGHKNAVSLRLEHLLKNSVRD